MALNGDDFEFLLAWLDPDRENAGRRYEEIRLRLIKVFKCRGCLTAEDLADETINRVCVKVKDLAPRYEGDPALYFYGVANNVHLESLKKKTLPLNPQVVSNHPAADAEVERKHECLDTCLERLPPRDRALALDYYREEKKGKIENRKEMAVRHGLTPNALRLRMFGIRGGLYQCVLECLGHKPVV